MEWHRGTRPRNQKGSLVDQLVAQLQTLLAQLALVIDQLQSWGDQ